MKIFSTIGRALGVTASLLGGMGYIWLLYSLFQNLINSTGLGTIIGFGLLFVIVFLLGFVIIPVLVMIILFCFLLD